MYSARISIAMLDQDRDTLVDSAHELLSCWYKNGQIVHDAWIFADSGACLEVYVTLPEADALERVHNNVYAERRWAAMPSAVSVTVLGEAPNLPSCCACPFRSALVLYTNYLSVSPPVRCLDCFAPVPLYRLPHIHDHEHLVILQWAADYRACDTLQMHGTTGERFGERQLFRHDSNLSRHGRSLGAALEKAVGVPVHYYLHKTSGRSRRAEASRRCPACNAPWRLERPLHGRFDFRCDPCRLFSAMGAIRGA